MLLFFGTICYALALWTSLLGMHTCTLSLGIYQNCIYKKFLPAVNQKRSFCGVMLRFHSPVEGQDWSSIVWYSMVRPGSEVELCHFQRSICTARQLCMHVELVAHHWEFLPCIHVYGMHLTKQNSNSISCRVHLGTVLTLTVNTLIR